MSVKRSSFDKTYKLILFLMPLLIGIVLILIQVTYEHQASQEKIQTEIANYKEHIKIRIMDEVYTAVYLADYYYQNHQEDYSPEQIKANIIEMLEGLHSDDVGYYFSANYSGITMIGPAKGENVYNIVDTNGLKVVQKLIERAKDGGGFVEYVMPPIENYDQVPKLSFVLPFEPYNWYIGAGVTLDQISMIEDEIRQSSKEKNRSIFLIMGISILSLMVILTFINNMIYSYVKDQINKLKNYLLASNRHDNPNLSNIRIQELADIGLHVQELIKERDQIQDEFSQQIKTLSMTSKNLEDANAALEEEVQDHEYALLRLEISEKRFEAMVHALPDAFFIINKNGVFIDCEVSDPSWLLYKKEDFLGQSIDKLLPKKLAEISLEKIQKTLETKKIQFLEYTLEENGRKYYEARFVYNASTEVFVIVRDVSPLKLAQVRNYYLKYSDPLTKLYNRRYFEEQLILLDRESSYPLGVLMIQINGLKLINNAFGYDVGDNLIKWAGSILEKETNSAACLARLGGDEFVVLFKNTSLQALEKIVKNINVCAKNTLFHHTLISFSIGKAIETGPSQRTQDIIRLAESSMYQEKIMDNRFMKEKTIEQILEHLNRKIPSEEIHGQRVGEISRALGQALNLDPESIDEFYLAGRLHDIGKITINHELLNKPTLLTQEEWQEIKLHPEGSYRIIKSVEAYGHLAKGILHHHERFDGSGYPDKLKGKEIPLISRIIAIADAFEAMTSHRPYRNKVSFEEAMAELNDQAGSQFDPDLVEIFEKHIYKNMNKL